ncbi:CBS domain-containing protein [Pseudonocardia oceani]|uniref:CBS domain-containing protein n=2 Tax=Pseudonocardia oceani TaxID=2792013 RepID=A0ABS6UHH4_9PSEU|nr:CBS domain-containing protein [Pseudonocardia oceani]MBW0092398.1 CBS domain-containing protein [Pseudonocardia oceani]MBW0122930.1 CBS domain-containing protein [Pseudonocardia oceani]MBW0131707.1 CBS domain-containing protein [Pseudonocardia oceani]
MTAPVLSARAHWPVARAAALMLRSGFTALPVVDEQDRLLGLVTEGDVLADRLLTGGRMRHSVSEVMTVDVLTAPPQLDLAALTRRLVAGGRRVVPVVEHGRLVGIVTRHDLLGTAPDGS